MLKKEKKINVFKCDRCGKEYEQTEELGIKEYPNAIADGESYDYFGRLSGELMLTKLTNKTYTDHPEDNVYVEDTVDLCPDCYTKLEEWLKGEEKETIEDDKD